MKTIINANADGTAPAITCCYAKGFTLSAALEKSNTLGNGGGHQRMAVLETYEEAHSDKHNG